MGGSGGGLKGQRHAKAPWGQALQPDRPGPRIKNPDPAHPLARVVPTTL